MTLAAIGTVVVALRCRRANRLPNSLRLRRRYRVLDIRWHHDRWEYLTVSVRCQQARPRWHAASHFRTLRSCSVLEADSAPGRPKSCQVVLSLQHESEDAPTY